MSENYIYNLGQKFESICSKFQTKNAILFSNRNHVTFNELDSYSNSIAAYLIKKGIIKNDVIAIFNEKTIESYSIMMACIKLGIIYTNLDSSSPKKRLQRMLRTCKIWWTYQSCFI